MLNPFVIAGLILTSVGLLQEAADDDKGPVKMIPGPAGKAGKPGEKGAAGKEGKEGKDGSTVVIPAKKASDG